jgi:hypothetical protein
VLFKDHVHFDASDFQMPAALKKTWHHNTTEATKGPELEKSNIVPN